MSDEKLHLDSKLLRDRPLSGPELLRSRELAAARAKVRADRRASYAHAAQVPERGLWSRLRRIFGRLVEDRGYL